MIEALVTYHLDLFTMGTQSKSKYTCTSYNRQGWGVDSYANPPNPHGRHPFNIITEEIYD